MSRLRLLRYRLMVLWGLLTRQRLSRRLRDEFNLWAEHRRGEAMERAHRFLADRALEQMNLCPHDRVLDLACGEGWAARLMGSRAGKDSLVVGIDISDEMIRRAQAKSADCENVKFLCASAEHIPCKDGLFTKVLCIEAFYYFEYQERVLCELFRVMAPGGKLFLLGCLYKDYQESHRYADALRVPVHMRSADEHKRLLENEGWASVQANEILRPPEAGRKPDPHDRGLLVTAQRPVSRNRAEASAAEAPCIAAAD